MKEANIFLDNTSKKQVIPFLFIVPFESNEFQICKRHVAFHFIFYEMNSPFKFYFDIDRRYKFEDLWQMYTNFQPQLIII